MRSVVGVFSVLVCLLAGCGGGLKDDPILALASVEALEEGKKLLAEGKYTQARPYFTHAFEVEPNSVSGREGLLLAADAMFLAGGEQNLIKAESRYRDFVNRFPTSEHTAYAQFQIGLCLANRVVRPDRDQSVTVEAISALLDVQRFYPTSTYSQQASEEIGRLRSRQAEHDYVVGRFYQRFGIPFAAAQRYEHILENYPDYGEPDKILLQLCRLYTVRPDGQQVNKGLAYCSRLAEEHPDSPWVKKIPKKLPDAIEEVEADADDDSVAVSSESGL
jgi:outer membrane protein assembly factor BamD